MLLISMRIESRMKITVFELHVFNSVVLKIFQRLLFSFIDVYDLFEMGNPNQKLDFITHLAKPKIFATILSLSDAE